MCGAGYEPGTATDTSRCVQCAAGFYKVVVGDAYCIGCEGEHQSTVAEGFTSLVVASRDSTAAVLPLLLGRLVPGSPFVAYHPSITPLAECLHACRSRRLAVRLQLHETFCRKYQVAPGRTHPEMNALPPTGYVLSGIAVAGGS